MASGIPGAVQYDKYMYPQYQVLETGHFSECAEYSLAATDANRTQQSTAQQQEIATNILVTLDELLAAVRDTKLDARSKNAAADTIKEARKEPSPAMLKKVAEKVGQMATIVDAGSKIAPHVEALGRFIGL